MRPEKGKFPPLRNLMILFQEFAGNALKHTERFIDHIALADATHCAVGASAALTAGDCSDPLNDLACMCDTDAGISETELQFLNEVSQMLKIDERTSKEIIRIAQALTMLERQRDRLISGEE